MLGWWWKASRRSRYSCLFSLPEPSTSAARKHALAHLLSSRQSCPTAVQKRSKFIGSSRLPLMRTNSLSESTLSAARSERNPSAARSAPCVCSGFRWGLHRRWHQARNQLSTTSRARTYGVVAQLSAPSGPNSPKSSTRCLLGCGLAMRECQYMNLT